ncbi:MAG TPA: ATP-binding protein [Halomicronema sp.]
MSQDKKYLQRVAGGLGVATFLSLTVSGVAFWSAKQNLETNHQIAHHLAIIKSLELLKDNLKEAELGQQSYLLLENNKTAFDRYGIGLLSVDQELRRLEKLFAGDSPQALNLQKLKLLANARLNLLKQGIELYQKNPQNVAAIINAQKIDTDHIQWLVRKMVAREQGNIRLKQQFAAINATQGIVTFLTGIILNLSIIIWLYKLIRNEAMERSQAEVKLQQLNGELETKVNEINIAKEAAEVANRTKTEFLANMNHELRTPLNGILGYAQILQRDPEITPKQLKGLNIIHQCGSHLLTLINDVLDLAKLESQKMELYPQDFHFANFLATTAEMCRIKAEQKGVAFKYQPSGQLPIAIYADDKRLRQVLLNLLSNAIKFTDFGSVTFKIEVLDQQSDIKEAKQAIPIYKIRFQIEDTGIGISTQKLDSIFLPFEQAGKRDRNAEGTGLGLAISQQIIEKMGSKIRVNSTIGKGTLFWFDLDLPAASDWSSQIETATVKVIGYQGERRKILVIDDHPENRSVVVNLLEPLGFKVLEAENGQEGFDTVIRIRPDLIITDVLMPMMDGLEMTRRLRQLPDLTTLPIIASPASLSHVDRQESIDAGCDSFFPKPIEFEGLLGLLQRLLQITWVYETKEVIQQLPVSVEPQELIAPPSSELTTLYKAAQGGFINDIQQEANRLKLLDPKYVSFANKLLELSQQFDDAAILDLVKQHIEPAKL